MCKHIFAAMAIMAILTVPATAGTITIDGSLSDWETLGLLSNDAVGDYDIGGTDLLRYGATISDGIFYAVVELVHSAATFDGDYLWCKAWINADANSATQLNNLWAGTDGSDIGLIWGRGVGAGNGSDKDYYFRGNNDSAWQTISGDVASGAHADSGSLLTHGVFEWSAPVSSISTALSGLPDGVTAGETWSVVFGVESFLPPPGSQSPDQSGAVTVSNAVPEPGTTALLIAGMIGLLAYAWKRRR